MTFATDQKDDDAGLSATSKAMLAARDEVIALWDASVRACIDGADQVADPILINTLPAFYDNLAEALTPAYPREQAGSHNNAMAVHGGERARMTPFRADQVIHEYQLFRDAIAVVAERIGLRFTAAEWRIVEVSIDTAMRAAVREFSAIHESFREKLAASMSHDMRNPLGLIMTGAQLIGMAPDLAAARLTAQKIQLGAVRLEQMLAQLVDALTFERGSQLPVVLAPFDIKELAEAVGQEFNVERRDRVAIRADSVQGYWCRDLLHRALENLISNAFKYGDGGLVTVRAQATQGRLMLSVHNTGNPIAADRLDRIFEYLWREVDGKTNKATQGWGIGLPFARSVAEGHGGSIAVDSGPDTGTTFLIDVPIDCRPFVKSV